MQKIKHMPQLPKKEVHPEANPEKAKDQENAVKIKTIEELNKKELIKVLNVQHQDEYKISAIENWEEILLSLSWKKNTESVKRWMKEHMEAYNDNGRLEWWFRVDFIDDPHSWCYRVIPCDLDEDYDIIIMWKHYVISKNNEKPRKNNRPKRNKNNYNSFKRKWPNEEALRQNTKEIFKSIEEDY